MLHGHIHDADGLPVADAQLTLVDGAGRHVARGRSSQDGYYHLVGSGDGSYQLIVGATGRPTQTRPVDLGGTPTQLSLQFDDSGALAGRGA
ncbi:carboxypeptidase-like regulatory domain-containing protein [Mycobacterium sp. pUA109]